MPLHTAVGSDVATLQALLAEVEASGEKIVGQPFPAGDSWAVVTEKKYTVVFDQPVTKAPPSKQPKTRKPQTR